ncbi:MAG: DUF58 domain-containing protein [archaeon]
MLTGDPLKLVVSALGFILTGMFTGNTILMSLGLITLIFTYTALDVQPPSGLQYRPPPESLIAYVDDELEITHRVIVEKGVGLITLGQDLPPHFKLVDGNNLQAYWVQEPEQVLELRYKLKCTRRGVYQISTLHWETRHPLQLKPTDKGTFPEETELIVKPRSFTAKRIRQQKIFTKIPMPAESRVRIGVPTTTFKELREYNTGDPYKTINWKATARRLMTPNSKPTVNEYEREGRRVVFIFLDTSEALSLGTSLKNSFEYAVQATLGLSEFYLSRQCMVGLCLFNSEEKESKEDIYENLKNVYLFPETGKIQQYRIHRLLLDTEVDVTENSIFEAADMMKGHIRGTNPLFIIVTRLTDENKENIVKGMNELRKYSRKNRNMKNIMIINVSGYSLSIKKRGDKTASRLLQYYEKAQLNTLRRLGVTAINWDPSQHSITEVLLKQVRQR